ncbi:pseudouridine synthase [Shewanella waksmanii]|uniref:pseudouridine synthase n=1 Tax=Shewanella waksmanii TaxID=213783 RepID=UPI00373605CF
MRLAKYLAMTGLCSRRAATRLIRDGRISINGRVANHIDCVTIAPDKQHCEQDLLCDGKPVAAIESLHYYAFNKPVGVDSRLLADNPASLLHFLPQSPRLYPVGRLDKDSHGLMLLTNDGELTQRLMHPDFAHKKHYVVEVERPFDEQFCTQMSQGISYKNVTTLPCQVAAISETRFNICLTQGLNRQIRRMCQALGYQVIDLKRVAIESLQLADLPPGEMRPLTATEIAALKG